MENNRNELSIQNMNCNDNVKLIKEKLFLNNEQAKNEIGIAMDFDLNVPDIKPDVDEIIRQKGSLVIEDVKQNKQQLTINVVLNYSILYISREDGGMIHSIEGKLPFTESLMLNDEMKDNACQVKAEIEDLNVMIVNSRKLNIRGVANYVCEGVRMVEYEIGTDIEAADEKIYKQHKTISLTQLLVNTRDTYRIKREFSIAQASSNIVEVLYSDVSKDSFDCRLMAGQLGFSGQVKLFAMYVCENQEIEYIDKEIPFNTVLELGGVSEEMIEDVEVSIGNYQVVVKADGDGEDRVLEADIVLNLQIRVYEERNICVLKDFYSTSMQVNPVYSTVTVENLLMKNSANIRILEQKKIDSGKPKVLLVCNSFGQVKLDGMEIVDTGVNVWGALEITIMYVSEGNDSAISCVHAQYPFSQLLDIKNITKDSYVRIRPESLSLSVTVTDARNLEIKAVINLCTMTFARKDAQVVTLVECGAAVDNETAIIGYVVKDNDTLWDIAKRFGTTMDEIMHYNQNVTELYPKAKLVIPRF